MHFDDPSLATAAKETDQGPWYRDLTRYHWFVLVVACLGWLFDTMDQQLFNLARNPAMRELLGAFKESPDFQSKVNFYGGLSTSVFLFGWGLGGLIFGILGDKIGRAKTMMLTILIYSLCTGLSALSVSVWDFMFYRFLTALGVGGEFAVGVALVAEVMPEHARARALGWVQALSAVGNMTAALIAIVLSQQSITEETGIGSWRVMFVIGALPALLAIAIRARLKEPERWKALRAEEDRGGKRLGSVSDLFSDPRWRRNTIIGMLLALSGIVGLWGIGFFSFDLIRTVFRQHFDTVLRPDLAALGLEPAELERRLASAIDQKLTFWTGITSLVQNLGAFLGIYAFSRITQYTGRKPAFLVAFILAFLSTSFTFWYLRNFSDIFWMIPIMGFCQIALFGGYAIYFPELFPTRLRSTGTSFCYNVGRLVACIGPFSLGLLTNAFDGYKADDPSLPMRYAGVTMCFFFVIGMVVVFFAPETKGKPLPEE